MSVSRRLSFRQVFTCLLAGLLLLTGCEMPDRPTTICEWPDIPMNAWVSPEFFSIIDTLRPTLIWSLDPAATCVPAEYRVQVWSVENYLPGASAGYLVMAGTTTTERFDWPADGPALLPGHSYYVHVTRMLPWWGEGLMESGGIFGYFSTGPICSDADPVSPPRLHWPPDNWIVDPTGGMGLEWESTMNCWPADNFYYEISDSQDFSDLLIGGPRPIEGEWLFSFFDLPWENCTRYYWRVRAEAPGVEDEPFSETWSFFVQFGDTLCPIPDLGGPDLPPDITTPPSVRVMAAAACRSGPLLDYAILDYLEPDQRAPVQGRNEDNSWWYILSPNLGSQCWISGRLVDLTGDFSQVPVVPAPPLSLPGATDTPAPPAQFDCSQYATNPAACDSSNYCRWDASVPPNGACVNR